MKQYTPIQYVAIDVATQFGLDKLTFEERIEWTKANLNNLENLLDKADVKPLYLKAVLALRKAQKGIPTGHLVGLDAVCSGTQLMSALIGDMVGAKHTGLIDPDVRPDAYSTCTNFMNETLGGGFSIPRKLAKEAFMTMFYGSKAVPKRVFGDKTPELQAFYKAAQKTAPGAYYLLDKLLKAWQPFALSHDWTMADGFNVHVKVMKKVETRIEVDELGHSTFEYEYYINEGERTGLSLGANTIHSVDAMVLREMHRRCNYDNVMVSEAKDIIDTNISDRESYSISTAPMEDETLARYQYLYERTGFCSMVVVPHIDYSNVWMLSDSYIRAIKKMLDMVSRTNSFKLVTVHDEYKCHPNYCNDMRKHYAHILAELAESSVLQDMLYQITGIKDYVVRQENNLGEFIRNSNYCTLLNISHTQTVTP